MLTRTYVVEDLVLGGVVLCIAGEERAKGERSVVKEVLRLSRHLADCVG